MDVKSLLEINSIFRGKLFIPKMCFILNPTNRIVIRNNNIYY